MVAAPNTKMRSCPHIGELLLKSGRTHCLWRFVQYFEFHVFKYLWNLPNVILLLLWHEWLSWRCLIRTQCLLLMIEFVGSHWQIALRHVRHPLCLSDLHLLKLHCLLNLFKNLNNLKVCLKVSCRHMRKLDQAERTLDVNTSSHRLVFLSSETKKAKWMPAREFLGQVHFQVKILLA